MDMTLKSFSNHSKLNWNILPEVEWVKKLIGPLVHKGNSVAEKEPSVEKLLTDVPEVPALSPQT